MRPTDEQARAVELFRTGDSLKINAFAGTGKTTTLTLLAASTSLSGIYLAFNKAIAGDAAEKFGGNVRCSTIHSLAFRSTPSSYKRGDKMTGRVNANALAEQLKLEPWLINDQVKLPPRSQAYLVLETLRRFLQGADGAPQPIDLAHYGKLSLLPVNARAEVCRITAQRARSVWSRMIDPADPHPLGHDGYLKLWALSRPRIGADFILLDEAQDTNPVIIDVLLSQDAQLICVGDKYQQIYEWRGAVNAMETIETAHTAFLTQSFRFGETIAAAASKVLRCLGEGRPMRGNPAVASRLTTDNPDAVLARTNASVLAEVMAAIERGIAPHIVGGTADLKRLLGGVFDLKAKKPTDVPEFFGFSSWDEVIEFVESGEGEHLRTFVALVERHGERKLWWAVKQVVDNEDEAQRIISTAHKAKGREWRTVRLVDDFLKSKPSGNGNGQDPLDPSEVRLFYVAMTRGREEIDIPPATLALFDATPILSEPEKTAPRVVAMVPRASGPEPQAKPVQAANGHVARRSGKGGARIVPPGRIDAPTAFRALTRSLYEYVQARQRGETVKDVRIDPVTAAYLVETWLKYQSGEGAQSLEQIMQLTQKSAPPPNEGS